MALFVLNTQGLTANNQAPFPQNITREAGYGNGDLGSPVLSFFEFREGAYITGGNTVSYSGVRLTSVLVDVTQTKNIVTTAINGRNGTVKEYVSDGDYVIVLTGKIVSNNNIYPVAEVLALKELMSVPDSLEFSCPFLEQFDITNVVVTDFTLNESEGFRNEQPFTISLLSDSIITLDLL